MSVNMRPKTAQMAHRRVCLDFSVSPQNLPFVFNICGLVLCEDGSSLWMTDLSHVQLQRNCADVANAAAACDDLAHESPMRGAIRTTTPTTYLVSGHQEKKGGFLSAAFLG